MGIQRGVSGLLVFILFLHHAVAVDQAVVNYMAEKMEVYYDVIDNLYDAYNTFKARITLKNTGNQDITYGNWEIFFSHIRIIEPKSFPFDDPKNDSYIFPGTGLAAEHVNGALYKLYPVQSFEGILSGKELKIVFTAQYWCVARTDLMPNWYIAAHGCTPKVIRNTAEQDVKYTADPDLLFVGKFDTRAKWKRYWTKDLKDRYDPYSPKTRYDKVNVEDLGGKRNVVMPTPLLATPITGMVNLLEGDWGITAASDINNEAKILSDALGVNIVTSTPGNVISLQVTPDLQINVSGKIYSSPEGYMLNIDPSTKQIKIQGLSKAGVFYGVQSLISLYVGSDTAGRLPGIKIVDAPRFGYRGMMVDVSRNFHKKDSIKKLIDAMAMYKMNKLHFHLTDDEGWRLEIPGLDELTDIGAKRCYDPDEKKCVISQLGSGPDDTSSGSGFYTVNEYKEILKYADDRHIEVIPEFDMPGHGHAAIKAMEARYHKLVKQGDPTGAKKFLLSELDDPSRYLSVQYFYDNAINPCLDSTYTFLDHLVKELLSMHKNIQPLTTFHFGGDEVAPGAWINSTACKQVLSNLKPGQDLKQHFVYKVSEIAAANGLNLSAWEDGLVNHTKHGVPESAYDITGIKTKEATGYAWQNVWEWGVANRAYKLANAGYKVVMSQATHLYFDHPEEPDPEERGYYWAPRFTDTRKTFGFMPDTLYENTDFKRSGDPVDKKWLCENTDCVPLNKPENIIGMQGQLWSETVRADRYLMWMIFPRLLAVAERAWHKAPWESEASKSARETAMNKDWTEFANTLGYKELGRLDKLDIEYRVPPPGYKDGEAACSFPGLQIKYSPDNGKTWTKDRPKTFTHISTWTRDDKRRSRLITMAVVSSGTQGNSLVSHLLILFIVLFIPLLQN